MATLVLFPGQKDTTAYLNQLKEITGVDNDNLLIQALEASKNEQGAYDLHQAVNMLVESPENKQAQNTVGSQTSEDSPKSTASLTSGVIDLTNDPSPDNGGGNNCDKEDDLQKAIALSLQDQKVLGGQVTMEDQDISRVLEASLAESKAVGTKRKRAEIWQDPINPNERKRIGDCAVGLKNVGNTCWFSSVIQSLFHLPIFRKLVLNFVPRKDWDSGVQNNAEKRNILFMQELRKLFSLMVCSKRKYVDPSQAVEILRDALPDNNSSDSQQDVSEFSHKLLEWLEEAFKHDSSQLTPNSNLKKSESQNPMLDLFYGNFKSEGHNNGHFFSNDETFGQYPLRVNGFSDIHDSLQAAMAQEIESSNSDSMTKSGQETWFTSLPPVLLFELSRFQFNQHLSRPEKIHNKLEFHEVMYMDRYMEYNKAKTRCKREQVKALKEERERYQSRLERYLNYGSGPKRVPLQDVLQYTLEFVESKTEASAAGGDVEMSSPSSSKEESSPCHTTKGLINRTPLPKHVSQDELSVLQGCLTRWRTEVETDVKALQDMVTNIDKQIKEIYNDPCLQKLPYRLHAVLVHEGQAASGHYWAYIYHPVKKRWLKFNDVTVSEASWSELQKDSMGGHYYASAYCLMYVNLQNRELFMDNKESEALTAVLPPELAAYVKQDNAAFQKELETWEASTLETLKKEDKQTSFNVYSPADKEPAIWKNSANTLRMEHAALLSKSTQQALEAMTSLWDTKSIPDILNEAVKREFHRIQAMSSRSKEKSEDNRLHHIGVFMLVNDEVPEPFLRLAVLDQFAYSDIDDCSNLIRIRQEALNQLQSFFWNLSSRKIKIYQTWQEDFRSFRKLVCMFVLGVENFHSRKYLESLPYLQSACALNSVLSQKGPKRSLNQNTLSHFRRKCLLEINKESADQFESSDLTGSLEALSIMINYVLPSMDALMQPEESHLDTLAAEEIRSRWCSMLGDEIESQKQVKLQDFLIKLLDPSASDIQCQKTAPVLRITDLEEKYHSVRDTLHVNSSEIEH